MVRNLIFSITVTLFFVGQVANVVAQQKPGGFKSLKPLQGSSTNPPLTFSPAKKKPALSAAPKTQAANDKEAAWVFLLDNGRLVTVNEWFLDSLEIRSNFGTNKIPLKSIVAIKMISDLQANEKGKEAKDEESASTKVVLIERRVAVATNTGEIYLGTTTFENFSVGFSWGSGSVDAPRVDSIISNRQGAKALTAPKSSNSLWTLTPVNLMKREIVLGRNQSSFGSTASSRTESLRQVPNNGFGRLKSFGTSAVRPDGKDVFGKTPTTPKRRASLIK